jgi:hypothetical protein
MNRNGVGLPLATAAHRYGHSSAVLRVRNAVLDLQLSHRSVRKFGPRKVTDDELAAQNAVVAAESLGLGSVFVGAVRNRPDEIAAELGLPPHTVAAFGLAVGEPDPAENAAVKPRLPQAAVLYHERYDAASADAHIPVYDARLAEYNRSHGLPGGWVDRVLKRLADPQSMAGRDKLRLILERRGLTSI